MIFTLYYIVNLSILQMHYFGGVRTLESAVLFHSLRGSGQLALRIRLQYHMNFYKIATNIIISLLINRTSYTIINGILLQFFKDMQVANGNGLKAMDILMGLF